MADPYFTYDISAGDTVSKMRLELGDTQYESGILPPDGRNFSDSELTYFYEAEDNDFWSAVARAFDSAAAEWAAYPDSMHLGPEFQKIPAASFYAGRAEAIRTQQQKPGAITVSKAEYAMDID